MRRERAIARCIEMGAEDYLSKPFNPVFMRGSHWRLSREKKRLRDQERRTYQALVERARKNILLRNSPKPLPTCAPCCRHPSTSPSKATGAFQPGEQLGGGRFRPSLDRLLTIWLSTFLMFCGPWRGSGAAFSVPFLNTIPR